MRIGDRLRKGGEPAFGLPLGCIRPPHRLKPVYSPECYDKVLALTDAKMI